jgi:diaminopimelate decarboxylase
MPNFSEVLKKEPTPFYIYDLKGLKERAQFFKSAMPKNGQAHFALKANNNRQVVLALK